MKLMIVADDLTGALDSAAPFAMAGLRTEVLRRVAGPVTVDPAVEVLAISTGSRDGTPEAAAQKVAAVLDALPGLPALVMKKVDSRLKGHLAIETALLARRAGRERLLVLPAIPELGRVVAAGAVDGRGVDRPIPVAPRFAPLNIVAPDCATDADLDAALAAGPLGDRLMVGARGLSQALARRIGGAATAPAPRLAAPFRMAIGSRDPITLAQVAALDGIVAEPAPDGAVAPEDAGGAVTLVQMTAGATPCPAPVAGSRFARGVAARLRAAPPATLLACGGETADALLAELAIDRLHLAGDILPGVPLAFARLGDRPLAILTKSGGFGDVDSLRRLVAMVRKDSGSAGTSLPVGATT
ncbi:four-carbon acid sugar kinase family protein [Frigidibacter sp. MR17.24]|uniref:four-carbon acid sugar kinase family protein n=1 Tax=Frigidibacter sp. MR17.24 TaxID=3127345 RepID=UPI0030131215